MYAAGTELGEREPVLRRPVAAVPLEAVRGVLPGERAHRAVAQNLRDDARRGHRGALSVRPWEALYLGTERQVAIGQAAPGVRPQHREGSGEGLLVGRSDAELVDPPGREGHHGDSLRTAEHLPEDPLTGGDVEDFRVVD